MFSSAGDNLAEDESAPGSALRSWVTSSHFSCLIHRSVVTRVPRARREYDSFHQSILLTRICRRSCAPCTPRVRLLSPFYFDKDLSSLVCAMARREYDSFHRSILTRICRHSCASCTPRVRLLSLIYSADKDLSSLVRIVHAASTTPFTDLFC